MGEGVVGHGLQSYCTRRGADLVDDPRVNGRVLHQPALADFVTAGLELRLHQGDDVAIGRKQRRHDRQDVRAAR